MTHYLLHNGIVIYIANADGYEEDYNYEDIDDTEDCSGDRWEENCDYEDTDDYDEPYDRYDEVGYNPYMGGYDSDW